VAEEEIAIPILLGCPEVIREKIISLGLDCCAEIINPNIFDKLNTYTQAYAELRQRKGITRREAAKRVLDPNVFGSLMVKMGDADAFVSGLTYEYPEVIRP
jgi:malate dehydrogenase (oxaloacetate-decarboxylating)(NADP+)